MLKLTKHNHPDRTVISIAALMIEDMQKKRICQYDALRTHVKNVLSHLENVDALFLPAINFMFMLGLIEYRPKTDSFEFASSATPSKNVSSGVEKEVKTTKKDKKN